MNQEPLIWSDLTIYFTLKEACGASIIDFEITMEEEVSP